MRNVRSLLKPLWWFTSCPWTQPFLRAARALAGEERSACWKRRLAPQLPAPVLFRVEAVHRTGDRGAFVVGWMLDPCSEVARVELVVGSQCVDLTRHWARSPRTTRSPLG